MREAAITLPLDVVERLIEQAADHEPDDTTAIDLARREVAQVKEMLNGGASAKD